MEKKSLKQILAELKKTWEEAKYTEYQAVREWQLNKPASHQQKMIHLNHLKKKFKFLKKTLEIRINKPGTWVKFKLGNDIYIGTFPSMGKEDSQTYLEILAQFRNCPLEILEIKDIKSEILKS